MTQPIEIGRLLRAGTTGFIAGCRVNQLSVPSFGALVRAPLTDGYQVYGLIHDIHIDDDGLVRQFDISDPFKPVQVMAQRVGEQVNMVSQSWDGKRLYFTSSLLSNWDKQAPAGPDLQYFKLYKWDGKSLVPEFSIDFIAAGLGLPHQMRFGSYALYGLRRPQAPEMLSSTDD